ncbi:16S rRNA (cytosine(967)-C(5))-methyltransferase RsmB, partial [Bacteroidota bacterium]
LKLSEKNLERLGVKNVLLKEDISDYSNEYFDRVLVDVPCSGLGTITKKPDIKWKRDISDIRKLNGLQYELLCKGADLVKNGGILVYSTCSIEPEENFYIVKEFLNNHQNFKLLNANSHFDNNLLDENGCVQTYPHIHLIDGSFASKLIRQN